MRNLTLLASICVVTTMALPSPASAEPLILTLEDDQSGQTPEPAPGQTTIHAKATPGTAAPRFTFRRVDDGLLRLDSANGKIAFCGPHQGSWACEAVPENRAALEQENARLRAEVAQLQAEAAAAREPQLQRQRANAKPRSDGDGVNFLKGEDIARARVAFEHAWRRVIEMILGFQRDMMRKVRSDRASL